MQAKPTAEDLEKLTAALKLPEALLTKPNEGLGQDFFPVRG